MIHMKAMILAGGFGKRLRPLTETTPKPLIPVGGKPILEWQIGWLKKYGYSTFIITASYLADKIIDHLGDGSKWGVEVEVVIEKEALGTGGALKSVEHLLKGEKEFAVLNGDNITNLDMNRILLGKYAASLALTPLQSPYGIVNVEGDRITSFAEKPILKEYWINSGVYKMTPKIFSYLPQNGAIENTAFPELASQGMLGGVKFDDCYWRGVDSIKDMEEVNKYLNENKVY
ncbi:MAG: nucleotidyltransferase family protein [Candidatus Micrarchaeota archaeon]|nr:nucleotidyltransferase family protein [Candidatus Micrarchaeota archaeon]